MVPVSILRLAPSVSSRTRLFTHGSIVSCGHATLCRSRLDRLPLSPRSKQALSGLGINALFEIQLLAFDSILRGRSVVARSRTGTGKTLAYLLPLVERMRREKHAAPHSLLILVPSRELCLQVASVLRSLQDQSVALLHGGPSLSSQEETVRGAPVIVATPGRCARLCDRGSLLASNVRAVVLDEVDAMLGAEYAGRVQRVLAAVSKPGLQTVCFAATLPDAVIQQLQRFGSHELIDAVALGGQIRAASGVFETAHVAIAAASDLRSRIRLLLHVMHVRLVALEDQCIVFVDRKSDADAMQACPSWLLRHSAVHEESTFDERQLALERFGKGEIQVLIATDVLARGIDFQGVRLVLQLRPPRDASSYLHRAGRTGRAGLPGTSITLFDSSERPLLQKLSSDLCQRFQTEQPPSTVEVRHAKARRLIATLVGVPASDYESFLASTKRLSHPCVSRLLAKSIAVLDARESGPRVSLSLLSGRPGFVCMLARDQDHEAASTESELRRAVLALLPRHKHAIGSVAPVQGGWAFDVAARFSSLLDGRKTPCELSVATTAPRLARRTRRLPWMRSRKPHAPCAPS